jgi:TetR/AcrR family transcriptional regulator, transcriptional repressor for nem operon
MGFEMGRVSNKRERLIESATKLFHQAGLKDTSIADIAEDSEVPLGNVYYYFKTKEDLVAAVIEQRTEAIKNEARQWEENPDPRQRLLSLLDMQISMKDNIAKYGCPIGSMCQELDKERPPVASEADGLMNWVLKWITRQFKEMGQKQADRLGLQLMSALQGCGVIANALKDPKIVEMELTRLKAWIKEM